VALSKDSATAQADDHIRQRATQATQHAHDVEPADEAETTQANSASGPEPAPRSSTALLGFAGS
jgi:hypothetical protein